MMYRGRFSKIEPCGYQSTHGRPPEQGSLERNETNNTACKSPRSFYFVAFLALPSSGAESWLHSRTPHDVANLGQLLGMSQEQSLRALSDTPLAVLRRAEARKSR